MKKPEIDRTIGFMLDISKLKATKRTGWLLGNVSNPEHVGDHSFSTALLSYIIAKNLGLNPEKAMTMALIHDINEVITGDIAIRAKESEQLVSNAEKERIERQNTLRVLSHLDKRTYLALKKIWNEFAAQKSREAKLVNEIDHLDYIMQLASYSKQIKDDEFAIEFFTSAKKVITTPELLYIYDKIRKQVSKERRVKLQK